TCCYIDALCFDRNGRAAVQFGVNILNFGPGARPDAFARWAEISEALGYHSLMLSDHVAITPGVVDRYPEPFYDCFTTLAWLAGRTTRIRLGTTVNVVPYRNPVHTARLVANVDQLSGGRFVYGIGVGNVAAEFAVLGAPYERRGAATNEALRIMLALWNSSEPVSLDTRYYHVQDVYGIPTLQQPHPPIWVGGGSDAALRRTARYGQAWHPILRSMDLLAQAPGDIARLKALASEAGRPAPAFCPRIRLDLHDQVLGDDRVPGAGSIDQVRADLQRLQDLGAEHVTLDWYTGDLDATTDHERGWRMLAVLAEQVLDLEAETLR
ncbi:MAG: TIGR03619 family F420-dependent LLM class oxidoreductase, partial [Dehalococcoidia bacterium]